MSVDTRAVQGRRELRFTSFDEMIADAENLVTSPDTRTLGNWPLGQLLAHLALLIDKSIDGMPAPAPWYFRLVGVFIKGRVLGKGMTPGFNLPKGVEASLYPAVSSAREGLESFRQAAARTKTERMSARHPILGNLTHEEWTQLHLRHAALHLGFAVPGDVPMTPLASGRA